MYTADDERLWSFKPGMGGTPRVDRFTLRDLDGKVLREATISGYLASPAGAGDDLDYMHARFCSPLASVAPQ